MLRSNFFRIAGSFWIATCSLSVIAADANKSKPAAIHSLTHSGDQGAVDALDRELREARTDPIRLGALEQRLLKELAHSEATFAARQTIAQRLGMVLAANSVSASSATSKTLGAMLADERDSDLARLALEPAAGPAIDALFVQALPKASGRARLGIIDSIAVRRITSAVGVLTPLLQETDPALARAAARALGEIGTATALSALRAAPVEITAHARLAAAVRLPPAEGIALLRELQIEEGAPAAVRHAAFRTALDLEPASASARIIEALSGADWARKQVALEAIAASHAPNLIPAIAGKLSGWDAHTQAGAITALARRADAVAVPAVMKAVTHSESEVRSAAIAALGFLPGSPETASILARIAADTTSDEARIARQSLSRLNGAGVSKSILDGAAKGDPARRAVYLEQLALRNQTEDLPLLINARDDPDLNIRLAAVGALGDLARVSDQPVLLDWAIKAIDEVEQARALRSLVNVTLRDSDTATRGRIVFAAIERAAPEIALRLMPALSRIGGAASADAAARIALRNDAQLAEAATAALARWTDGSALPALATVADKAALPAVRDAAREGAVRYLERNREAWRPETTDVLKRLIGSTNDPTLKKQLIAFLHRADDRRALELTESLEADPALASSAKIAAEIIRANLAGLPNLRASGGASNLKNMFDYKTSTRWSAPTAGEEWLEIDFRQSRPLTRITLDQTTRAAEFPERYEVYVTDDISRPGEVVASGEGQRNKTVIEFPADTRGRYVVIKNVAERKDSNWSVVELYVD